MDGPAAVAAERSAGAGLCPACGSGDLYRTAIARRDGDAGGGAYCAGVYDRDRRRYVRRSCGYAGALDPRGPAGSAGPDAPVRAAD